MRKVKNRIRGFYYTIRNNLFRLVRKIKRAYSEAKESHQRKMFHRNKKVLLFIDRWNLGDVFSLMIAWIFIMAVGYYVLSMCNIGSVECDNKKVQTFSDFLYFSFISFTTVGYGDLVPIGACKIISVFEGMSNFLFMGVFISKLTSYKNEYMMRRIYTAELEERLQGFTNGLNEGHDAILKMFMCKKWDEKNLQKVLNVVLGARRYIGYETYYGDMYTDVSQKVVLNFLKSIVNFYNEINKNKSIFDTTGIGEKENKVLYKIIQTEAIIANIIFENDKTDRLKGKKYCQRIIIDAINFSKRYLGNELKVNGEIVKKKKLYVD